MTRFLYDGDELIAEYSSTGTLLRRYIHGASVDDPLVWFEGASVGTTRRHLYADHQGSVIAVSDQSMALMAVNRYDDWGTPDSTNFGRFQYTGQAWIPELGMYHYKARIYSPTLGRFLQTDPIGYEDQHNLYAYVGNDPVNGRDPTGMCRERDGDGECVVNNRAGTEGEATTAELQTQVRVVDQAIQNLDRRARLEITTKDGETRTVTGAQLQRAWNRTSWNVETNSTTFRNGLGAEMSSSGVFRGTSNYINSFADRAEDWGRDRGGATRSVVLHDFTHFTSPGRRIIGNFPLPRGAGTSHPIFVEREQRTSRGAATIATSIGVSFECATFDRGCGP